MQIARVLYPTDFSEASYHALPHATEAARRLQAELVLLHIKSPDPDDPLLQEYYCFDEKSYLRFVQGELEKIAQQLEGKVAVSTAVHRDSSAASGILEFSEEEEGIDLIVMGAHGRSALSRFFVGSVTERVVRYARVPVLTVGPDRPDYRSRAAYRKVLAAYDFSEHSKNACLHARAFAARYGADFEILYVIEQEVLPGYLEEWKLSSRNELPSIETQARRSLLEVLGEHGLDDVAVHVVMGDGDGRVYRDINRFALENEVDLLVLGTYGLSGFEHLILGSTTERVLRSAPCPVLVYH